MPPDPLPRFGDRRAIRIGLLGGSFNPAHAGHAHVAQTALRRLRLDQVWLLVSPGNPLKPAVGMAPLADRLAGARAIADGRRVIATAIESRLGTRYTVDTLERLRRHFPRARFVWLMGADLLPELPRWQRWRHMLRAMPFIVLPRPGYTRAALSGCVARRLAHARHSPAVLAGAPAPAWSVLTASQMAVSASAIRARKGTGAGVRRNKEGVVP